MEPAYTEFNTVFADLSKYFDYKVEKKSYKVPPELFEGYGFALFFNTIYMPLCEHTPKLRADNI